MVTVMLTISATGMTTIAPSPRPKTARLAKAEAERARTDGRGRLSIENSLAGGGGDVGDSGVGNDDDGPPASIWCNTPLGLSSDLYDAPPNGPRITGDGGNAVGKARGRAEERGAATSAASTSSYSCSVVPQAAYLRRARARECMARIRAKSKEARDAVERIREKVATTVAADLRRARARERMARIRAKSKEAADLRRARAHIPLTTMLAGLIAPQSSSSSSSTSPSMGGGIGRRRNGNGGGSGGGDGSGSGPSLSSSSSSYRGVTFGQSSSSIGGRRDCSTTFGNPHGCEKATFGDESKAMDVTTPSDAIVGVDAPREGSGEDGDSDATGIVSKRAKTAEKEESETMAP
jgi:hypothetical protein